MKDLVIEIYTEARDGSILEARQQKLVGRRLAVVRKKDSIVSPTRSDLLCYTEDSGELFRCYMGAWCLVARRLEIEKPDEDHVEYVIDSMARRKRIGNLFTSQIPDLQGRINVLEEDDGD